MKEFDSIIIGSGIAGMTAAIYLKRENINVLVIEKEMPGGQMVKSPMIENYPGFDKIEGATLALQIHKQMTDLSVESTYETVIEIKEEGMYKIVKTSTNEYKTKTILLATGREPRELGLPNEKKLIGRGISYCATCDGAFYKGKEVAVIGGGNSAVIESIFLANLCKKVTLIYRKEELRSEESLKKQLENLPNVEILYNTEVHKLNEENGKLHSLTFQDNTECLVDGLFIYIGFIPNVEYLRSLNIEMEKDYVIVNSQMMTNIPGIYACGDSIKKDVYQLTTAVGEAATAADFIKKEILVKE